MQIPCYISILLNRLYRLRPYRAVDIVFLPLDALADHNAIYGSSAHIFTYFCSLHFESCFVTDTAGLWNAGYPRSMLHFALPKKIYFIRNFIPNSGLFGFLLIRVAYTVYVCYCYCQPSATVTVAIRFLQHLIPPS